MQKQLAEQQALAAASRSASLAEQAGAGPRRTSVQTRSGAVQPIRHEPRACRWHRTSPPPIPVQQQLDDQRVLREAISDEFDVTTLLDVDDALSFRRPGIGTDVTRKLRQGRLEHPARDWTCTACARDEAREAWAASSAKRHERWRALRARGARQGPGLARQVPVLKGKVHSWLIQKNEVLAFVQARASEGGAGALVVLLTPS